MINKIKEQLVFSSGSLGTKTKNIIWPSRIITSLLVIVIGIFLLPKTAWLADVTPEKLIELTNQERLAAGLNTLTANQLLTKAAWEKAQEILRTQIFKHNINGRKFSDWIQTAGYNYSYVGENLAIDFVTSEGVIDAWNSSPLHRQNLLNSYYEEIGIAAIAGNFDGQETTVVVQIFGAPPPAVVQPRVFSQPTFTTAAINYFDNNYSYAKLIPAENLLTHSTVNQSLLLTSNLSTVNQSLLLASNQPITINNFTLLEKNSLTGLTYINNKLNNFFEQLNTLAWPLPNFFAIFVSLLMLALLVYFYYFYFFRAARLLRL